MKVFLYCPVDTGGQSARLAKALRDFEGIDAHSMAVRAHINRYPEDLKFDPEKAKRMFAEADVIHLHNSMSLPKRLELPTDKPIVLHHHGTRFREYHERLYPEAKLAGVTQIASTIDLAMLYPDITWLPTPHNLVALQAYRDVAIREGRLKRRLRIRIAHAPTNRTVKSTTRVMQAVTVLHERFKLPVELELIERVSWATCLARKAASDILVDQLHLGYGNNAVEAWAMGIPVVAGVDDPRVMEAMEATFPRPFVRATEATLQDQLEALVRDPDMRLEWAQRGMVYAHTFHDERYVAHRLASIYRKMLGQQEAVA